MSSKKITCQHGQLVSTILLMSFLIGSVSTGFLIFKKLDTLYFCIIYLTNQKLGLVEVNDASLQRIVEIHKTVIKWIFFQVTKNNGAYPHSRNPQLDSHLKSGFTLKSHTIHRYLQTLTGT